MNYRSAILPAVLLGVAACSAADVNKIGPDVTDLTASESRGVVPASIALSPATTTIAVDETTKLNPVLRDSHGELISKAKGARGVWSSSDTTVASVSAVSGTIQGLKDGVTTITLSADGTSGNATLTVGKGAAQPASTPSAGTAPAPTATPAPSEPNTPTPAPTTPVPTTPVPTTPVPTTPVPTTPTTPTQPVTASVGAGLSGKALKYDDFTKYSSTSDLMANVAEMAGGTGDLNTVLYNDGWTGGLLALDRTMLYNGHPTMKYNQPGGTGATPEVYSYFHGTLRKMWFRAKVRWSKGYTTTGTLTNSASAYKLFGWGWRGYNGRGEVAITNTNQYQMGWGSTDNGVTLAGAPEVVAGRVVDEWSGDQWYDYIVQWEITSPTTAVSRVWIAKDGETPVLRATAVGSTIGGAPLPAVNRIALGENFNQQRAAGQNQAIWYGQWEVVDGEQYTNPFGLSGF